jgi:hypothetical protein
VDAKVVFPDEKDRKFIKDCLEIFDGEIIKIVDLSH